MLFQIHGLQVHSIKVKTLKKMTKRFTNEKKKKGEFICARLGVFYQRY